MASLEMDEEKYPEAEANVKIALEIYKVHCTFILSACIQDAIFETRQLQKSYFIYSRYVSFDMAFYF